MLSVFFAFFFTFTPSPTDSFVTAFSVAFDGSARKAPAVEGPLVPEAKPAVAAVVAPVVSTSDPAPAPGLFAAGGLLDPSKLSNIPLSQTSRLSADAVVGKVQNFYKDTAHLRAKFRQTVRNETFGKESVSDGWVYIKKPGKMRWDYYSKKNTKKVSKSFISDGTFIWAVFHQDLQFYKKSVKDDLLPVAITFLSGQGDLRKDFTAEIDTKSKFGKKGDYVVKLTPRKPNAQYSNLWLIVDSKTFRVKQSVVLNSKGDTNRFAFHEGDTTKAIKDTVFAFDEKRNKKFRLVNPDEAPSK